MLEVVPGWAVEVERGPDWLFVRLHGPSPGGGEPVDLAKKLWAMMEKHFTYRLVLELENLPILPSYLIGQLVLLHKRIHKHDGLLRLCGLSKENREVLRACRLHERLPHYRNREDAVVGQPPTHPR